MAIRFQPFTLLGSRTADSPRGAAEPGATREVVATLTFEVDPLEATGLQLPTGLEVGVEVVEATLDLTYVALKFSASAIKGRDYYVQQLAAGAVSKVVQADPIRDFTSIVSSGLVVNAPTPSLVFASPAVASLGIGAGDSVEVVLRVRDVLSASEGRAWVGRYIDDAFEVAPATMRTTTAMQTLLDANEARCQVGVNNSEPVYVNACALATVDPSNVVYIASTDIGVGGTKIPAELANNSAAQYAFHPNVFVRRPQYTRGVLPAADRDTDGITAAGGAAVLMVAQYAFTYSRWLVQIDGTEYDIIVDHNGGAYQRPVDIYQKVLAVRFSETKVTMYRRDLAGDPAVATFTPVGVLRRFDFAQYLRFLDGYNLTNDAPFAVYAQTGNPPVDV